MVRYLKLSACCLAGTLCVASLGCQAADLDLPQASGDMAMESAESAAPAAGEALTEQAARNQADAPARSPELIKQANLSLTVTDMDEAITQASSVIRQHQGDILDLQDNQPQRGRHSYLRVRVPQAELDPTLADLAALGTVTQRSITAEDVSNQLVDLDARLRNLRKSEEALLKIMERSGAIADVLEVSRELSNVRQTIEQLDAQLKSLRNQVAYSTIHLHLEATISTAPGLPLGERVGTTWQAATQSVGDFTVGLLQLGLWLLAYSPYLAIVALAAALGYRVLRRPTADS